MTDVNQTVPTTRLGYYRSASTGAFSTLIIFALCWAGVALGLPLTLPHGFVSLFTLQPVGSVTALLIGGVFAFLAGGLGGAVIAHCYNLSGRWPRRMTAPRPPRNNNQAQESTCKQGAVQT